MTTETPIPTPIPTPAPKPRKPFTLAEGLRLGGVLFVFLFVGLWLVQWLTTPRYRGATVATWCGRLADPDTAVRTHAVEALARLPVDDAAIVALRDRIPAEEDATIRKAALATLTTLLGGRVELRRATLDAYLATARDNDSPGHRRRAAEALAVLVAVHQPADGDALRAEYRPRVLALLLERLATQDGENLAALLDRLATIRPLPPEAEAPLLAAWASEPPAGRKRVVAVLLGVPTLSAVALPALLEQLGDDDLASAVLEYLQRLGPAALPELRRALLGGPAGGRPAVARALATLGDPGAAVLLDALARPGAGPAAADALVEAGPATRPFLLAQRDRHPDPATRRAVAALLERIPEGPREKPK